jgi:benzoate 4-monooxygenase
MVGILTGMAVAGMELACIVATTFRNFDFNDEHEGELETREGFLRKPLGYNVGIKRRD